ncbi:MAG: hypothetical protein HW401_558 [Parcubacteria group bacterium]|nr:hypothetical protein [Parcubacteria group bacterium]
MDLVILNGINKEEFLASLDAKEKEQKLSWLCFYMAVSDFYDSI